MKKDVANYIFLATRNPHKTHEIQIMLGEEILVTDAIGAAHLPEIEETGDTFEDNARLKAEGISHYVSGWVIADDSGLEVDALNGEPGVYSARYAGPDCTDLQNTELVLQKMVGVSEELRTARFRCVIAVAKEGKTVATFHGVVEGVLTTEIQGERGFGYDPIFIPLGYQKSFGELSSELKNSMSHRSRALEQFRSWWKKNQ
ncbi:MAG: non-canonical purine NTP pyrophosphatase, RdgB/HAM1 family [Verrucomicrobia bacterium RIFCSPHIGHO2_12_FULL_41_10]|nr:MAG: non-canonical purine NTP pyrophosphatase, RdgB/HAM1 family [Verrucomicrobia bacterium RIFCSPHIGHO2_12_FULL_41_10]HLB32857.1 RdgB/HAM1 family non-canonical purine NTP pyrophosphatase [Chthoniobacterales bacterium]